MKSPFLKWFYKQAGRPPMNNNQYLKLRHETIPSMRTALAKAESSLLEQERYNTAHQYALYAWMAKEQSK